MTKYNNATLTPGQFVLRDLRRQILTGELKPGDRFPTRVQLRDHYRTTLATLDRVFAQLLDDKIVFTSGRHGSFVALAPPFLKEYRIVYPYCDRPDRPWPHFWRALDEEAKKLKGQGLIITPAYGNETHLDEASYRDLLDAVESYRVGGLIFATPPSYMSESPVCRIPGIPRVALMEHVWAPQWKAVNLEPVFLQRAMGYLRDCGRRRMAVVVVGAMHEYAVAALREYSPESPLYWVQTANGEFPASARSVVNLLMAGSSAGKPDSLVIFDDNLVPDATAGLLDAGVRVPDEVLVVGHANFPYLTPSAVPLRRFGYDVPEIMQKALTLLTVHERKSELPDVLIAPMVARDHSP